MELYQLQAFVTVAALGHLTRAADKLHLSQPALSGRIKALEEELGVTLFERTPTGMTLTPAGRHLLAYGTRVLDAAREMKSQALGFRGQVTGHVRLGTSSDPDFIRLGQFLGETVARHPKLAIELHQEISGAAFEKVRDRELDASFYFGDLWHPEVESMPLRRFRYVVAGPAAWKEQLTHSSWSDLVAMPWIVTPEISTHHRVLQRLFAELSGAPDKIVQADQESVIVNLVESGVGLSLVREDLARAKERRGEIATWRGAAPDTVLAFIYRRDRAGDPVIGALLEVLQGTWELPATVPSRRSSNDAGPTGAGSV